MAKSSRNHDQMLEADKKFEQVAKETATTVVGTEASVSKKGTAGIGRPIAPLASKLVSYDLPLDLIDRIDKEADRVCGSNKNAMVEKAFEVYFASLKN